MNKPQSLVLKIKRNYNMFGDNQFISANDLSFSGVLHDIKRSKTALQPIFEAFTNALESIKIKQKSDENCCGKISLKIYINETAEHSAVFDSLSISDNGIGFNEDEFKRFNTYKLNTKGYKNLGSGRLQFVHYFGLTTVNSVFTQDNKFYKRMFLVSKNIEFIKHNAIVKHIYCKEVNINKYETTVTFESLLENSGIYNELNDNILKEKIIERYIHYFCYNKNKLPDIRIEFYSNNNKKGESAISILDFPDIDKTEIIKLHYSRKSEKASCFIDKTDKTEDFVIDAFKISANILKENKLNLVSKGEVVEESDVAFESLAVGDSVNGNKYLFLVSSNYIDAKDTNLRGVLNIYSRDAFIKDLLSVNKEEILIEDIQEQINEQINIMYPEIEEVKQTHEKEFVKLKEMFLLDEETAKNIKFSINDSESDVLKKFYEAEAKKAANLDAKLKESIDHLEELDTTSSNYNEELEKEIQKLVQEIPLQNKISLTQYVARRKLVLELFDLINKRKLSTQISGNRNNDEKLLHNLIFQQSTSKPEDSDLWLISEDFIYFNGSSEHTLKDVEIDGKKLLRDNLSKEEEEFRTSLNENRYAKRPDILLFPDEGKCLIIEFKNPDVNVSEHLTQINNYATIIWNFSNPKFKFETFYGYLIGEKINPLDVRFHDGEFKEAYHFDYLFRPHKVIPGFFTNGDASLYTEVIKYSTLYERAKKRNEIFIKKLGKSK